MSADGLDWKPKSRRTPRQSCVTRESYSLRRLISDLTIQLQVWNYRKTQGSADHLAGDLSCGYRECIRGAVRVELRTIRLESALTWACGLESPEVQPICGMSVSHAAHCYISVETRRILPMFHAAGWTFPWACTFAFATQVSISHQRRPKLIQVSRSPCAPSTFLPFGNTCCILVLAITVQHQPSRKVSCPSSYFMLGI